MTARIRACKRLSLEPQSLSSALLEVLYWSDHETGKGSLLNHPLVLLGPSFIKMQYIREYGSTLYVGLARAVSPTNTNFRLTFLLTRLQEVLYEDLAV